MEKPKSVSLAVNLSWASLVLGVVKIIVDSNGPTHQSPLIFVAFVLIITSALIVFLIFKISAGKNWARITLLVFFLLGMVPEIFIVLTEFARSAIVGIISVAQVLLQVYALFLLFTKPGSEWFRKNKMTV